MKIISSNYLLTAVNEQQCPEDGLPEIAMVGRSNVGKSSFINKLTNRKSMARTSSAPGKTRTMNFYIINEAFNLVDMPGYGYAKVGASARVEWGKMMEKYLTQRENLQGVILLIDLRHPPMKNDIETFNWLVDEGLPFFIVANKADKISRNAVFKNIKVIRDTLRLHSDFPVIAFSTETGQGVLETWSEMENWLPQTVSSQPKLAPPQKGNVK